MATAPTLILLRASDVIQAASEGEDLFLELRRDPLDAELYSGDVRIHVPDGDEDALLALELLEAAIDNAKSIVELRASRRFRAALEPRQEETGPEIGRGFPADRER